MTDQATYGTPTATSRRRQNVGAGSGFGAAEALVQQDEAGEREERLAGEVQQHLEPVGGHAAGGFGVRDRVHRDHAGEGEHPDDVGLVDVARGSGRVIGGGVVCVVSRHGIRLICGRSDLAAADLAGGGARQVVDELDGRRALVAAELFATSLLEVGRSELARRDAVAGDDVGDRDRAEDLVGPADDDRVERRRRRPSSTSSISRG